MNTIFKNRNRNSVVTGMILFLFILGFIQTGCKDGNEHAEKKGKDSVAAATATDAFILGKAQLSSSIRIPGELIAFQQVDVYAKVNSFIKKLYADVGTEVKAGQLLAILEAPEINSQLAGAASKLKAQEALYLASKANYDRLYETSKTPGTIAKNDLDQAEAHQKSDYAQLEAAKAAFREINDTRQYLEIHAPFSGVISARNVSAGAYVGPSGKGSDMPLFTLQEQKKLRLVVSVPEAYTSYVAVSGDISFTVNSIANQTFKAKVSRLAGALDTKLGSQHVEMDVINEDKHLLPGMVAEVSIPLQENTHAFVIPAKAVMNSTLGQFVIKVHTGQIVWVPVKTGRSSDDKTEVFGELEYGDTLVSHAGEEVRNHTAVTSLKLK